jgi:adenylate cyclase
MALPVTRSVRYQQNRLLLITTGFFTLLVIGLGSSIDYQYYEWRLRDQLARVGRRLPANPEVVVLGIDTASLTLDELMSDELAASPELQAMKEKGWPWPRWVYAPMIDKLAEAGAKVIAFDMLFPTAGVGDEQFKAALERHADRVVIGGSFAEIQSYGDEKAPFVPPSPTLIPPEDAAYDPRVGFVNFRADVDGRVRRTLYRTTYLEYSGFPARPDERELFSLAARMAQKAGYGELIPRGRKDLLFRFSYETNPRSIYQVFVPDLWKSQYGNGAFFKDKIVLIGPYGNWAKDVLDTPHGVRPGPQLHLSAFNALLKREFLTESTLLESILLVVLGGGVAFALGRWIASAPRRILLLFILVVAFAAGALLVYHTRGFFPILLSPLLALTVPSVVYLGLERLLEYLERMRVRRTLEQFVSRDVVQEVLDNPTSYLNTLGGARKPITVLFSDIRGFTTLTETAVPEKLVGQLQEYLTAMVRIVFAHGGTLDKFIGDAVMAHWGAIKTEGKEADARNAVEAALEMLRALPALNADWTADGLPPFRIGIGVNHGEPICGQLGSEQKREFTAIGDAVNLTARLESATKELRQEILLGETTAALVRDRFTLRTVDLLQVKGRAQPVEAFTVLDLGAGVAPPAWLAQWEEAIRLYRQRKFAEAERAFTAVQTEIPEDPLVQEYLRRVREYLVTPPPEEWDGVFTLKKK